MLPVDSADGYQWAYIMHALSCRLVVHTCVVRGSSPSAATFLCSTPPLPPALPWAYVRLDTMTTHTFDNTERKQNDFNTLVQSSHSEWFLNSFKNEEWGQIQTSFIIQIYFSLRKFNALNPIALSEFLCPQADFCARAVLIQPTITRKLLCPLGGGIKRWCASDVCLTTSVEYIRPAGGMCGRPTGWDTAYWLIGPGSVGLAQGCRCASVADGGGILWRPPAQLFIIITQL